MIEQHDDVDENFVETFETAWSSLLRERGTLTGKHEERILRLQQEALEMKTSKDNVEKELKKQTAFFRSSREEMEVTYRHKIQGAVAEQRAVQTKLETKLDDITVAEQLAQKNLPWKHFVAELDRLITAKAQHNPPTEASAFAKPSARAIFLLQTMKNADGDVNMLHRRASRIDHALIKAQVSMLEQEIERHERMFVLQQEAGEFLTEHNVWELLKQEMPLPSI